MDNDIYNNAYEQGCQDTMTKFAHQMGKWREHTTIDGGVHYICNKCLFELELMYGTPKENSYNYCPNCGAKMKQV